jgi:hypothetical protein
MAPFVRVAPEIQRGLPHPGWSACIALIAPWVRTRFSFFASTFSVNRHGRFRASAIFRRIARRAPLLSSWQPAMRWRVTEQGRCLHVWKSVLRYEDLIKLNIYLRDVHTTDFLEQVAAELAPASNPAVTLAGKRRGKAESLR